MDDFLADQTLGDALDTKGFTLSPELSRSKLIESTPTEPNDAVLRLLDATSVSLGQEPGTNEALLKYDFYAHFPNKDGALAALLGKELNAPFGKPSAAGSLAKALLRAKALDSNLRVNWSNSKREIFTGRNKLISNSEGLELPQNSDFKGEILSIFIRANPRLRVKELRNSPMRTLSRATLKTQSVLPLDCLDHGVTGYFSGRSKPFSAMQAYYWSEPDWEHQSFDLDLWKGPHSQIDPQSWLLNKRESKKMLFFRWKPSYRKPTILHHSLNGEISTGAKSCRAIFWFGPSDTPCRVHFLSQGVFSDPVNFGGPRGLNAAIIWPTLKHDIWGTAVVRDDEFEKAMDWTRKQAGAATDVLRKNLEAILSGILDSGCVPQLYQEEVISRLRQDWSKKFSF